MPIFIRLLYVSIYEKNQDEKHKRTTVTCAIFQEPNVEVPAPRVNRERIHMTSLLAAVHAAVNTLPTNNGCVLLLLMVQKSGELTS